MEKNSSIDGVLVALLAVIAVIALVHFTDGSEFIDHANDWLVQTRDNFDLPSPKELWHSIHDLGHDGLSQLLNLGKSTK